MSTKSQSYNEQIDTAAMTSSSDSHSPSLEMPTSVLGRCKSKDRSFRNWEALPQEMWDEICEKLVTMSVDFPDFLNVSRFSEAACLASFRVAPTLFTVKTDTDCTLLSEWLARVAWLGREDLKQKLPGALEIVLDGIPSIQSLQKLGEGIRGINDHVQQSEEEEGSEGQGTAVTVRVAGGFFDAFGKLEPRTDPESLDLSEKEKTVAFFFDSRLSTLKYRTEQNDDWNCMMDFQRELASYASGIGKSLPSAVLASDRTFPMSSLYEVPAETLEVKFKSRSRMDMKLLGILMRENTHVKHLIVHDSSNSKDALEELERSFKDQELVLGFPEQIQTVKFVPSEHD